MHAPKDLPSGLFVNLNVSYTDLVRNVMRASGGERYFDTFIHSTVQSNEVRSKLLDMYQPVASLFYGDYQNLWAPHFKRLGRQLPVSPPFNEIEASRWTSAALALRLVRQAEVARGARYARVYLTRPDLQLWRGADLRRYCADRVYSNHGYQPYFPGGGMRTDFHFVMSSEAAEAFSTVDRHLGEFRFGENASNPMDTSGASNDAIRQFVQRVVGRPYVPDHLVIGRHEELSRKMGSGAARRASFAALGPECFDPAVPEARGGGALSGLTRK